MTPTRRWAAGLLALASLAFGGCTTDHFRRRPTPENFVADGVNGVAAGVGMAALVVVAAPVLVVSEIADAIHTAPCACACDQDAGPRPVPAPSRAGTLPARYVPGWERQLAPVVPALAPPAGY